MFLSRLKETITFIIAFAFVLFLLTVGMVIITVFDWLSVLFFGIVMIFFGLTCLAAAWKFIYWLFIEPFIRKGR